MIVWNIFEVIGTVAFAISGVLVGANKQLDIFGVLMLSLTTAVGGGIIRDTLIGNTPPLAFRDPTFVMISIATAVIACLTLQYLVNFKGTLQFFDAIGLGAFTATGASLAPTELNTLFVMIVLGAITGIGGGIVRDILAQEIPLVFQKEIYAVASIIGSTTMFCTQFFLSKPIALYLCFVVTVSVRLLCLRFDIHLPKVKAMPLTDSAAKSFDSSQVKD